MVRTVVEDTVVAVSRAPVTKTIVWVSENNRKVFSQLKQP